MRQPQAKSIGLHNADRDAGKASPQLPRSPRMCFHGDHLGPGLDQVTSDRSLTSPNVENEFPGADMGVSDDPRGPRVGQRMPAPFPPGTPEAGHDGP